MMAQDFGSRQMDRLRRTIGASAVLSAIGALVLFGRGAGGDCTHPEASADAGRHSGGYGAVSPDYVWGRSVVMAYNLFAGMIRSLGDSKTPLYAMMVASCVNIGLDLLFVLVFHWGNRRGRRQQLSSPKCLLQGSACGIWESFPFSR